MKNIKFLVMSALAICFFTAVAQPTYKPNKGINYHTYAKEKWPSGKKFADQKSDSGQHAVTSLFVDRRAKKWSLGLGGGATLFWGDADHIKPSWHARAFGKYSVSQTLGFKAEWNIGMLRGSRDYQFPTQFKDYFRFKSRFQDFTVQMMFTLGNISFLRPLRKTQLNLFIGGGWGTFRSIAWYVDQRLYVGSDYYLSHYLGYGRPNPDFGKSVTERYEGRHWVVPFGFGVKHNLGRYFDIGAEYRQTYLRNDDIDVYNTPIWQNRWFDQYSLLNIYGAWKLGNKNPQHYDWLSPVESIYDKIKKVEDKLDSLSTDKDGDGVADFWDDEANTPDSCHVYGNGVSVDTDGDGVPDCRDKQNGSDRGCEVDENGKMIDTDEDGVPDCRDKEPNSPRGAQVAHDGTTIKSNCCNCEDMSFPGLSGQSCEMTGANEVAMSIVVDKMKQCMDKKLVVCVGASGGKSKKGIYASKKGASAACQREAIVNYLTSRGISRDRIILDESCASENGVSFRFERTGRSSR